MHGKNTTLEPFYNINHLDQHFFGLVMCNRAVEYNMATFSKLSLAVRLQEG